MSLIQIGCGPLDWTEGAIRRIHRFAMQRTVINIAIASPGDVKAERQAAKDVFTRWNESHKEAILHPKMWELAAPSLGAHPQALLNEKIIEESELLIAIFWSRLGTPTPSAKSGTVEEIREFIKRKGPGRVMIYYCTRPLPNKIDPAELARLREFQTMMQSEGVYQEYEDVLAFERDLYSHLDQKVDELLRNKLPLPDSVARPTRKVETKTLPADKRLHNPIDFGTSLQEISQRFAARMNDFNKIDGCTNDKFYALGAHVYDSVAICIDHFLTYSATGLEARETSVLEKISTRLKKLAAGLPAPGAPFPEYWAKGQDIADDLSAHAAHVEKRKK